MSRKKKRRQELIAPDAPVAEAVPASEPPASSSRKDLLWGLLLIIATILAYQQAWHAGYIWDDDKYVTANPLLTAPDGLWRIWFSLDSPSQYFPLVYSSFRLEHALWGLSPVGYHWVNILLHATNAWLVWRLLVRLRVPGAWLAAGLFALHPVHVESVAWITERKNVLMGLFFLLSLHAWNAFIGDERRKWRWYLLALVCYALALFSKTTACTLPAALLLIVWLKYKRISWSRVVEIIPFVALGIAMGLVTIWWERHHQGTQGELFAIAFPERLLIAARATWFYLGKLLWPTNLAFSYPRWTISAADPLAYFWVIACLVAASAVLLLRRRLGRGVETAALFFIATLAPVLGFIMLYTFRYSFVADHYQYLASIGPLALAAAGLTRGLQYLPSRVQLPQPTLCTALLVILGMLTWRQSGIYHDETTLWRATIATNPQSWMAHNNLAIELVRTGQIDDAIGEYGKALELNPSFAEAQFNLGNAFVRASNTPAAALQYRRALELNPNYAAAAENLGAILLGTGRVEEAVGYLQSAVANGPAVASAHQRLGDCLLRLKRTEEGVAELQRALELDPRSVEARSNLGLEFAQEGRMEAAAAELERALQIQPDSSGIMTTLGNVLLLSGDNDHALLLLTRAVQLAPVNAEAQFTLGNALLQSRRPDEAVAAFQTAVELRPGYARAGNNLANALAELGRTDEAIAEYERVLQINPDYAAAHSNLARALTRAGRTEQAQAHLERAEELSRIR